MPRMTTSVSNITLSESTAEKSDLPKRLGLPSMPQQPPAMSLAPRFKFVSQSPGQSDDPIAKQAARSHAVRHALKAKRLVEQQVNGNFRVLIPRPTTGTRHRRQGSVADRDKPLEQGVAAVSIEIAAPIVHVRTGRLDPFETLAADSGRLMMLVNHPQSRQATEPVFNVSGGAAFMNFRSVFRTGLDDPALLNAVMLTLSFGVAGSIMDNECLAYKCRTIEMVSQRMSHSDRAATEATLGAILLLTGIEARQGMRSHVQVHLKGMQQLLGLCESGQVHLTDGIKRAIFWQDLNASVIAGSDRIVSHDTFSELQWKRDPFSRSLYTLPPGFRPVSGLLGDDFVEVLEDIRGLQCIRDADNFAFDDPVSMLHLDNHQAWIESRLVGLPRPSLPLECCQLGAYLCAYMLCSVVWGGSLIPTHISSKLLYKLQQAIDDALWDDHPELLVWLLYMGGTFSPPGITRAGYIVMLHQSQQARFRGLFGSWLELAQILQRFIWSAAAYEPHAKRFGQEVLDSLVNS